MSDPAMSCQKCHNAPAQKAWGLCVNCASEKTKIQDQQKQLVASSAKKEKGKASTAEAIWEIFLQERKTILFVAYPYFTKNAKSIAKLIYDDAANGNIKRKSESSAGDQYTIKTFQGTCSLDFQGCRQGGNTYWLDYQGQVGGGSSERNTYFQVMIMCGTDISVPPEDLIADAIRKSNGQAQRSVLYLNTTDRPK